MSRNKLLLATALLILGSPVSAQDVMNAEAAREFIAGHMFSYQCFDGTYGAGRVFADGSAIGSIRVTGRGSTHYMQLPTNTLYVYGSQICARLRSLPFEPCFNLVKTGPDTFRGSVSHMNFMYCNFNRGSGIQLARKRGTSTSEATVEQKFEKKLEPKTEKSPAAASSFDGMQLRR
jgi:hypothetical protein